MSDKLTPEEALAANADLVAAARDRSVILDWDEAQRVIVELWDALAASQDRVRQWRAVEGDLLALTPGGSEFAGSPQRCLEFIKDRMATVMKVAAKNKTLEAELKATQAQVRELEAELRQYRDAHGDVVRRLGMAAPEPPGDAAERQQQRRWDALSEPPGEEGT